MKSLCRLLVQLARCTSGSALLEMTIVTPVAIGLAAGVVDFGMAFSTQASVGKAARDAARYLAGLPSSPTSSPTYCRPWAIANATSLVTTIIPSATVSVLVNGVALPTSCPISAVITVQVQDTYNSFILASFLPIASQYVLSAQHEEVQVGG
jgi:Flp pilus assembly protein TadG